MARTAWYVVQVSAGKERMMAHLVEQIYRETAAAEAWFEDSGTELVEMSLPGTDPVEVPGRGAKHCREALPDRTQQPRGAISGIPINSEIDVPNSVSPVTEVLEVPGETECNGRCEASHTSAADIEPFTLEECFAPRFITQKKIRGEFVNVERQLISGYVIAVTDNPAALARMVAGIPEFCHVIACGDAYLPLTDCETGWLNEFTARENRVMPMSFGHKEGDVLVVDSGPLKGKEAIIARINRSASLAFLEFHVGNVCIKTTVGLGILPADSTGGTNT